MASKKEVKEETKDEVVLEGSSTPTVVPDPTWNTPGWTAQYVYRQIQGATPVPEDVWDANSLVV